MKSPTTVEVLFTTAFTFPFLISLCIFYREKSWQSHKPRALAWWSISAAVSATLSQLIFWTSFFQGFSAGSFLTVTLRATPSPAEQSFHFSRCLPGSAAQVGTG